MFKRVPGAIVALTLGLTLAACGGGTHSDAGSSSAGTPSSFPTATSPPTGTGTADADADADGQEHNAADVMFATMMISHHQGAIEMSDLALTRAVTPQVKDLAGRIKAAQGPEIEQMQGWLAAWAAAMPMAGTMPMTGTETTDSIDTDSDMGHGMDHGAPASTDASAPPATSGATGDADDTGTGTGTGTGTMMSMSESDMAALAAATGVEFDRLFLAQMIAHHQGAIDIAAVETAQGRNPQALALALAIAGGQAAEITEMQQLLAGL